MRRAKTDRNQKALVGAYRTLGASVQVLHRVGEGCPDILLGIHGLNVLQEIKFGNARLTGDEPDWHGRWTGQVEIVRSTEDDAVNVAVARFEYWRDVADALAELTRKL